MRNSSETFCFQGGRYYLCFCFFSSPPPPCRYLRHYLDASVFEQSFHIVRYSTAILRRLPCLMAPLEKLVTTFNVPELRSGDFREHLCALSQRFCVQYLGCDKHVQRLVSSRNFSSKSQSKPQDRKQHNHLQNRSQFSPILGLYYPLRGRSFPEARF